MFLHELAILDILESKRITNKAKKQKAVIGVTQSNILSTEDKLG